MNIPNLPHLECPVGADETANPEIKLWGEKPAIENPKDHVELAANLGMISFEDGARIERAENVKDVTNYISRIDEMIERKRSGLKKYLEIGSAQDE